MEKFGGSGGRKKYVSQAQLQKLAEGGKQADSIKKLSNSDHENFDIPETERLMQEAEKAYAEKNTSNDENVIIEKISFLEKIKNFIIRIFYPIEK